MGGEEEDVDMGEKGLGGGGGSGQAGGVRSVRSHTEVRTLPSGWLLWGGLRVSCETWANGKNQISGEWTPPNPRRHVPRPECPPQVKVSVPEKRGTCVPVLPSSRCRFKESHMAGLRRC